MGDFSAHFHRPESGIHTVEGNVAGSRAASLTKKRQREQAEFEEKKTKISKDASKASSSIHDKFANDSSLTTAEKTFRNKTIGLVSAEEFKRASREAQHEEEEDTCTVKQQQPITQEEREKQERLVKKKKRKSLKQKKKTMATLSFAHDEEEQDLLLNDEPKIQNLKDPTVDTSFLPDKLREQHQQEERRRLEQEWKQTQQSIKEETLEIVYSYWDGSGHRRSLQVKKGNTIGEFLEKVRKSLCKEFRELASSSTDALLYVKEDLILPHDVTFYDLIVTKARGKSGPLFHFDVHDDVPVGPLDSRVEKDEAHPGKVVERQWYDRNKHIFPASRWEVYDPQKDYGGYTIHGKEVVHAKK